MQTWLLIGVPLAAYVLAWSGWAVFRRVAAYRRLNRALRELGAHNGIVGRPRLSGNNRFNGPFVVGVSAIQSGDADAATRTLIRSARERGYRTSNAKPPCGQSTPCTFGAAASLPMVVVRTFQPGTLLPGTRVRVPEGHCGLVVTAS
ncbi:MAG TPA: hypothetical protein VM677_17325 [Actinokineospora sp.]|nr:hypothetical protein [Actinokineospora sp.]